MYTLRIIVEDSESNFNLGNSYNVVDRFMNYDRFCQVFKSHFNRNHIADLDPTSDEHTKKVFAFVLSEKRELFPIYEDYQHYIMTENGKTFCKLKR